MFQVVVGVGIFTSAFLIFFIQLLLAKHMLPQFGGSAFVWVTSILFFQTGLLLGYLYAYLLVKIPSKRLQAIIHFGLLLASLYFIPIQLDGFVINNQQWPPISVWQLLSCISLLPFIVICASSPLLQHWYCQIKESEFPYYFYSISNAGSLIGLVGYPFLIEPIMGLHQQAQCWTLMYLCYCFICFLCMVQLLRTKKSPEYAKVAFDVTILRANQWLFLSFISSALLLAVTQFLTQNVINLPLMWVIPLGLYLLSFIVTFSKTAGYDRNFWLCSFLIFLTLTLWLIYMESLAGYDVVLVLLGLLYSACMICHGELILRKPSLRSLTTFYLLISLGGVLGSLFVNIVAYVLLGKWWDFYIPLILLTIIVLLLSYQCYRQKKLPWETEVLISTCLIIILGLTIVCMIKPKTDVLAEKRSLYGFIRVLDHLPKTANGYREMRNGQITHGVQFLNSDKQNIPTTYYGENSGIQLTIEFLRQHHKQPLNIAVIGLGCGTIASLGAKGDNIDFYELDENVKDFAYRYFTYLSSSPANIRVILGDARLSMVKAQFASGFKQYDLIVADAFNGDAIPFHLLTHEAINLYKTLLAKNGIIALHTTNTYIAFYPLTSNLAKDQGLQHSWIETKANPGKLYYTNYWAILSSDPEFATWIKQQKGITLDNTNTQSSILWTDDFNSILPLLRMLSF
jgi:spermidine synthase